MPYSKVYGVATFYHFFTMKPPGKHTCVVCTGTACHIKGAPMLLNAVQEAAKIKPGETTADGSLSLLTARCLGSCGLAPAVVFDGQVAGKITTEGIKTGCWLTWASDHEGEAWRWRSTNEPGRSGKYFRANQAGREPLRPRHQGLRGRRLPFGQRRAGEDAAGK